MEYAYGETLIHNAVNFMKAFKNNTGLHVLDTCQNPGGFDITGWVNLTAIIR